MSVKWTSRVRQGLKRKGYVYKDLAARLNVTEGAVSHYLNGIREPSLNQIKEISKMIDMPISEILGDDAVFVSDKEAIEAVELIKEMSADNKEIALRLLQSLSDKK